MGGSPPAIAGHLPPCGVNEQDQDGPRDYLQPSADYQPGILIQEAIYNSTHPQQFFNPRGQQMLTAVCASLQPVAKTLLRLPRF